jgi:uncharacterized protein
MSVSLNRTAYNHADSLISHGKVNTGAWSFDAADGNKLLGPKGTDWTSYGTWFLGVDASAASDTKDHYKYPFGKDGEVYLAALRAIRSRASQQGAGAIFGAAGRLLQAAKADDGESKSVEGGDVRSLLDAEIRADGGDGGARLVGYAAVFDSLSEDLGGFKEVIRPGAFRAALEGSDVRALVNHDTSKVLGRNTAGTLRLRETPRGLQFELDPPDTSYARDLLVSVARGDMNQGSFKFYMFSDSKRGQSWSATPSGVVREITEFADIDEISIVTFPAYTATAVSLRSLEDYRRSQPRRDAAWLAQAEMQIRLAEAG